MSPGVQEPQDVDRVPGGPRPGVQRAMLRIRWMAVAFAFVQILTYYRPYPPGILRVALGVAVAFTLASGLLHVGWSRATTLAERRRLSVAGLGIDVAVVSALLFVYAFDPGTVVFVIVYILALEGALIGRLRGALLTMGVAAAVYAAREVYAAAVYGSDLLVTSITFRMGVGFIIAAVAGSMAQSLVNESNQLRVALARLDERSRQAERLLEAIGEARLGLVASQDGRVTYVNNAFLQISGYTREETNAIEGITTLLSPPIGHLDRAPHPAAARLPQQRFESEFRRRDGSVVELEVSTATLDLAGHPATVAIIGDVTERKRLELMKEAFLTAVSHELRTPLTAILGFAYTLGRENLPLTTDQTRDILRRLVVRAKKLDRLLGDLLDVNRLARGVIQPLRRPTDLGALVTNIASEPELVGYRNVRVDAEQVVVHVDAGKVERMVENLLSNAAKHTPAEATIWISVRGHEGGALIAVDDDGPGVPAERRAEVFEAFRRGHDDEHPSPGVGVGLTLVARFAQLHGGRAWVEERAGGGASFRVFLPDAAPEPGAA